MAFTSLLRRARTDERGNMSIILALSALPLVMTIALAMSVYSAYGVKSRFDSAADAAVLAAAQGAVNYVKQNAGSSGSGSDLTSAAIAAGQSAGTQAFWANLGSADSSVQQTVKPTITVTSSTVQVNSQTVNQFTADASFSQTIAVPLGNLFNRPTLTLSGSAEATANYPIYLDIHILIDNSASMGIGATSADQTTMQNQTGCTVACHQPWNGMSGVWPANQGTYPAIRAITPAVTLRIDVVKQAVIQELQAIQQSTFSGQVRVALYTFSVTPVTLFALSSDINGAIAAAQNIDIVAGPNGGGTYSSNALQTLASQLATAGDGSSPTKRQGNVLFFTDGVQDASDKLANTDDNISNYGGCGGPNFYLYGVYICDWGYIEGMDPAYCDGVKNKGYYMYTLDFIYLINPSQYSDSRYDFIGNTLGPQIMSNMQACATNSSYATSASTPDQFVSALSQLVNKILLPARIVK